MTHCEKHEYHRLNCDACQAAAEIQRQKASDLDWLEAHPDAQQIFYPVLLEWEIFMFGPVPLGRGKTLHEAIQAAREAEGKE